MLEIKRENPLVEPSTSCIDLVRSAGRFQWLQWKEPLSAFRGRYPDPVGLLMDRRENQCVEISTKQVEVLVHFWPNYSDPLLARCYHCWHIWRMAGECSVGNKERASLVDAVESEEPSQPILLFCATEVLNGCRRTSSVDYFDKDQSLVFGRTRERAHVSGDTQAKTSATSDSLPNLNSCNQSCDHGCICCCDVAKIESHFAVRFLSTALPVIPFLPPLSFRSHIAGPSTFQIENSGFSVVPNRWGVSVDFEPSQGTGGGSCAQETQNINFPKEKAQV